MSIGNIIHSGFISSIHKDNLNPWYTTTANNEEIFFKDNDGNQRQLNSLTIYSESTPLYIQIMPSEYVIYIEPNDCVEYNFESVKSIKVLGNAPQKIRWFGLFY